MISIDEMPSALSASFRRKSPSVLYGILELRPSRRNETITLSSEHVTGNGTMPPSKKMVGFYETTQMVKTT